jgi:hypothetical protein
MLPNPAEYAAIIAEHGETMTLKRTGQSDLSLKGKRAGMPIDNGETGAERSEQIDVRIGRAEIAAASWPEPPKHTDRLVIGGRTFVVMAVQQHDDRGVVYGWKLQVVG